ncbi:MAG: ABC transporter substrate-binding protein [Neptuniibacter sp.]
MIRWVLLLLALSPSTWASEFALGASDKDATVKVGCLFPLGGRSGLYGQDSAVGIRLAFEWLEMQSVEYPPIRVLIADSSSKASKATRLARDFIRKDKARFICGVVNSNIALQVAKVAEDEKAFFIGTDHASSKLTGTNVSPYYFRVNNNTQQSMHAAASYIKEKFKAIKADQPLRISYIGPDYDYGYQTWQDLRTSLEKKGVDFEIVTALWPRLYESDYTPYLKALLEKPTDLIVNSLWGGDLIAFVRQANQTHLFRHARFANFDTGSNYDVLAALGDDMPDGLILSSRHHNNWPDTKYNQWFIKRFKALSGRYPSYAAEGAYSGMLAIANVMAEVGVDAKDDEIRSALQQLTISLPEDPQGFTSFMDAEKHQLQQVIAIGVTMPNTAFPPATHMLGDWRIYYPQSDQ